MTILTNPPQKITYDPDAAAAGDLNAQAAVAEAERIFDQLRSEGATAVRTKPGGEPGERMDAFDPHAKDVTVLKNWVGG